MDSSLNRPPVQPYVLVEGTGHYPMLEKPEAFAALLERMVKGVARVE